MTPDFWKAIDDVATAWRSSAMVDRVIHELPRNNKAPLSGIPELLQKFYAGGLKSEPLQLGSSINFALGQKVWSSYPRPSNLDPWLRAAAALEQAHRLQVTWIRAQLPGYPMLRVPQLVAGTEYTTREYTRQLVWLREDYQHGFQLTSTPPKATLGAEAVDLRDATIHLVQTLQATDPWRRFEEMQSMLTGDDVDILRKACSTLRATLRPEAIDEFEPMLSARRAEYRRQNLAVTLAELTGLPSDYAEAFGALTREMDRALGHVLGELVAYGRPKDIGPITNLDFIDAETLAFVCDGDFLNTGSLVYLPDPLVAEVGMVMGMNIHVEAGVETLQAEVDLLTGARAAWNL